MISTVIVASLVAVATAAAGDAPAAIKPWKAAGPDDSRSPCPMLNTLANHGYL